MNRALRQLKAITPKAPARPAPDREEEAEQVRKMEDHAQRLIAGYRAQVAAAASRADSPPAAAPRGPDPAPGARRPTLTLDATLAHLAALRLARGDESDVDAVI